jgi:glucuronoarabinoxylan endo-1,4-beta-xylanase
MMNMPPNRTLTTPPAIFHSKTSRSVIVTVLFFFLLAMALAILVLAVPAQQHPITIDWGTEYQEIDGFGASSAGNIPALTSAQADVFFRTLGYSLLRIKIYPDFSECEADEGRGQCVKVASGPTLSSADLAIAKQAVAYGVTVWAAEWSPPGNMKSNHDFGTGGNMIGNTTNYAALANIQAAFVTMMAANGVPIYGISPQNEPDQSTRYPSCIWTGQQFHDYIPYLHGALAAAGHSEVKIIMPEEGEWNFYQAAETFNDSTTAAMADILAGHNYGGPGSALSLSHITTQHTWETEVSDFNNYDGTITSALSYAQQIHGNLVTPQVNAWHYWLLTGYDRTNNEGLTDSGGKLAKRAYAVGNYAKFVRPGWHRVGGSNTGSLLVTAFQNATGTQSSIVVINPDRAQVNQTFSVGAKVGSAVTPWVTSRRLSLAPQPAIPVENGSFTYTLPANSIVTFAIVR